MPTAATLRRLAVTAALGLAAGLAASSPASAHPHVWITAKAELAYEAGRVTGIRHAWTFDPEYTAFLTQGLDANGDGKVSPEELQGSA
ncbi:DUF1007 family protein, partial [Methylorubrum rhodesianum]